MRIAYTPEQERLRRVHGGLGIDTSYPVHRYFVAAGYHEFVLGGATARLRRIGAELARD